MARSPHVPDLFDVHTVVVLRRPGYSQFQQEFTIRPFETARLRLDLQKANPK